MKGGKDMEKFVCRPINWIGRHLKDSIMILVISIMVSGLLLYTVSKFNKDIVIACEGKSQKYSTSRTKVGDALESLGIEVARKDKVSPPLGEALKDGMTITIERAVPVGITLDGNEIVIDSAEKTVGNMLKAEGITLNEKDKIIPALDSPIKGGLQVKIIRVEEKLVSSFVKIPFKTKKSFNYNLEKGKTKVLQNGAEGEKEIITKITYEDGKIVSRVKVGEKIKKSPTNKIVSVGTLSWIASSRGGRILYTNRIRMKATSYTADYACTGKRPGDRGFGITATGTRAKRNPSGYSTVAVDPRVIPLGTRLYIEGYGYAIAEDVGGGVRGNVIDLYFEPGTREYRNWHTHYLYVYILK